MWLVLTSSQVEFHRQLDQGILLPLPPKMPSATRINIIPLHPTFVAEVQGIDWTKPVDQETFAEIKHAIDKVRWFVYSQPLT